ncbi:lantibiotic dehydratase [Streptosporangium sp. NPDC002524]|uniref:lantibiotic dehydratase n=1 Tax=Streptosporangium sp. NPDC002524 TaxID=3154537 RepID=UPI0033329496
MTVPTRYRHTGLVLVRATTDPGDLVVPAHLDASDPAAVQAEGRTWLAMIWSRDDVREALRVASPTLATRIDQFLTPGTRPAPIKDLRRAIMSTASYLLRWQRRPTPFGMFAGVTAAAIGPAAAKIGAGHRALARVDAEWLQMLVDQLESHPGLRPHLTVVADSGGIVRDGSFIVAERARVGARTPGPMREIVVPLTRPLQAALSAAASPIRFDALAEALAGSFSTASPEQIRGLLHSLVDQHILITSLCPPTTADPLAHVIGALRAAGAEDLPDTAAVLDQLEALSEHLAHPTTASPQSAGIPASAAAQMTRLTPGIRPVLAVDVALDGQITVPERVLEEATRAASVLLRLTTAPFGTAAWLDYHARFRTRYGPGTLVPVRELVADSGLGYPGGYPGAPRARPSWRMLTERDAVLLALIQQATRDGTDIALTGADIEALTVGEYTDIVPPQRIELGVTVHAASTAAIDAGTFELQITAAPRAYTSMAGRFAPLLGDTDRALLAASYAAGDQDAVAMQLSFPPRRAHTANVVRVPRLLPDVVSLSEHPDGAVIGVDDLAVTVDADQMYLVQRSTGRRVIPRIPHALDAGVHTPPLARFIAEVADARTAIFGPFDLGAAARTLPYVPRIRYRRTVLSAARWIVTSTGVSAIPAGTAWDAAVSAWRQRRHIPARVVLRDGQMRLPLDLEQRLDRALLRARLERSGRVEVQEDRPDGRGWIAGRPAELLIPMTALNPPPRRLPVTAAPGAVLRPGDSAVVHAQIVGNPARFDEILARHLPAFAGELGDLVEEWWVRRYRDMIRLDTDQHLAVIVRLTSPQGYGPVAARLAAFAAGLQARGLPAHLSLVSHVQHPARYGHGPALTAAERVFAADTAAAIAQIRMVDAAGIPAQALAAASMAHLSAAFSRDPSSGYRALVGCLKQQTGPVESSVRDHALRLADPTEDFQAVRVLPDGDAVAAAWQVRGEALAAYHHALSSQRDAGTVLRTLLHEHHMRALGVDPEFEKATGRLARAAALRRLALAGAL